MDYMKANKEAWEEAFSRRKNGWGEDVADNLQSRPDFYINPTIKAILDQQELASKNIAHFCCNNGRELLSIAKYYGAKGTGFDIAENLVLQGNQTSEKLGLPCKFVAANILPLPDEDGYRSDITVALEHKYFTKEPWIETSGMGYISGEYESKTFTSFAHSMEEIVNSVIKSNMDIRMLNEYDYDIGLSDAYDGKGLPLSMLLVTERK